MSTVVMSAEVLDYKHLIPEALWERLVGRVAEENELPVDQAELIVDGALGFLELCAAHPGHRFVPSRKVDLGWHAFLMYTREYREFCGRVAGRFIHHEPTDDGTKPRVADANRTIAFMKKRGIPFRAEVWLRQGSGSCDPGPPDCGEGDCSSDPSCE